jgi:UDP-3-O-[3-hydroxymyristoyl] glucosamine N-acyltransferase
LGAQTLEDAAVRRESDLPFLRRFLRAFAIELAKENAMKTTARELADYLGAQLSGDPAAVIVGLASPESAAAEDLIYIDSPRFAKRALASAAQCVLSIPGLEYPGKTVLAIERPKFCFAKAAAWLFPTASARPGIHPSAVVALSVNISVNATVGPCAVIEQDVEIGEGTQVGALCSIGRGSKLGRHCCLYPRVTLYPGTKLGDGVVVHSGTVIGSDGFGYVFGEGRHWKFPQIGTVEIGDDVEIGANTTIDRGSLGATIVGAGSKIDNLVQIGHNVRLGENTIVAGLSGISGSCTIGAGTVIAAQVGIGDHCTVGKDVTMGGRTGVLPGKIVRDGAVISGFPSRPMERFKEQYGWVSRLPELAGRVKKLEQENVERK